MDRVIGMTKPRLDRTQEWGGWFVSLDRTPLVFDRRESGNYQVDLAALTVDDARMRVEELARKSWATQRIVDDLQKALKKLTPHELPFVDVRY